MFLSSSPFNPSLLIVPPIICSPCYTLFLVLHCSLILHRLSLSDALQMFTVIYTLKFSNSPAVAGSRAGILLLHRK